MPSIDDLFHPIRRVPYIDISSGKQLTALPLQNTAQKAGHGSPVTPEWVMFLIYPTYSVNWCIF